MQNLIFAYLFLVQHPKSGRASSITRFLDHSTTYHSQ